MADHKTDDHPDGNYPCGMMPDNTFQTDVLPLLCENPLPVINWLKQHGLLKHEMHCQSCHNRMNWTKHSRSKDGFAWKCQTRYCKKYKFTATIRTGSFFSKSHVTLQKWVHAIYLWSERVGERTATRHVNISEKTMIDCYSFFREVCSKHFQANPIQLGGLGIIVEIEESCFTQKPKHHRGQAPHTPVPPISPVWVFSITDTSTKPTTGYMEVVQSRDAATLLPIIQAVIQPGSIIYCDEWRAYCNLQDLSGDTNKPVNSSINFVDPHCGAHTRTVESYWNRHKSHIKTMRGCKRDFMNSYLTEFMWHDRYSDNAFENFCKHIALQYPM
ncbi:uncharacterized protein LOC121877180 [Homarus americanus]|uniref:uncharacterized protein LOC121877180 n=1 Tax=Homarus americanus TaxID=6706 RepID=UPI001C48974F|nr:uncharacterized protein LOC121877180 [Homarus americanus]XP_042238736.1 uncharacterized protein LOC121877180 [Homarus americanus]XP_042238742.1 uncharacterized protein LOC121877180 [Homarus americanus]XP_042238748.1 uncharacterized protein LOC121877180 [Homarus americanus]